MWSPPAQLPALAIGRQPHPAPDDLEGDGARGVVLGQVLAAAKGYTRIRDAAFSVYALRRVGLASEAWAFLAWVLSLIQGGSRPAVLYDLDGRVPAEEWVDPQLEGYRASVRWANEAGDQHQHDVFGEVLDCAYQWAAGGRR
jgi:GH15 family glucan-1,4-alpha-glucosidase